MASRILHNVFIKNRTMLPILLMRRLAIRYPPLRIIIRDGWIPGLKAFKTSWKNVRDDDLGGDLNGSVLRWSELEQNTHDPGGWKICFPGSSEAEQGR